MAGSLEPGRARELNASRILPRSRSNPSDNARDVANVSHINNLTSGVNPDHPFGGQVDTREVDGKTMAFSSLQFRGRTGLVVRASDSGSGDPDSILGRVGVLFP